MSYCVRIQVVNPINGATESHAVDNISYEKLMELNYLFTNGIKGCVKGETMGNTLREPDGYPSYAMQHGYNPNNEKLITWIQWKE